MGLTSDTNADIYDIFCSQEAAIICHYAGQPLHQSEMAVTPVHLKKKKKKSK